MALKFPNIPISLVEEPIGISNLGTPVYDRLIIEGGSYDDLNGNTVTYRELVFNDAMITVVQGRNVVTTKIQGRSGTVKEFISNDDYEINVQGKIVGLWQYQPKAEIKKLVAIFKAETELTAYSKFLNDLFGITQFVIIGKPNISVVEGSRNTVNFSFRALSYEDIKLEILEDA